MNNMIAVTWDQYGANIATPCISKNQQSPYMESPMGADISTSFPYRWKKSIYLLVLGSCDIIE